jgi:hypothetical protein
MKYAYNDPGVKVYQLRVFNIPSESGPYAYNTKGKSFDEDPLNNLRTPGDKTVPVFNAKIPFINGWKDIEDVIFPPINNLTHFNLYADGEVVYEYIYNIIATD